MKVHQLIHYGVSRNKHNQPFHIGQVPVLAQVQDIILEKFCKYVKSLKMEMDKDDPLAILMKKTVSGCFYSQVAHNDFSIGTCDMAPI